MTKAVMETASERYRRITAERRKAAELHDFTSPSGMVWKLRRLDLSTMVSMGILPMHYAARVAKSRESNDGDMLAAFADLDFDDKVRTIDIANKAVRYCAVLPRIVETATKPDEIGIDEVELDDYNAIAAWALKQGGDEVLNLDTFPSE